MKRICFLILLLFPFPLWLFSTCIVIFKTKTSIIVAADSKRTIHYGFGDQIDNAFCKIHKIGKFYCAISGFDDSGQLIIAEKASKQSKTLESLIARFNILMSDSLAKSTESYRKVYGEQSYRNRFGSSTAIETSFFCFERNKPRIITLIFRTANRMDGKIAINSKTIIDKVITFLGFHEILDTLSTKTAINKLSTKDAIGTLRDFVRMEIKANPKAIGEPIDILKLTAIRESWISKKTNCN